MSVDPQAQSPTQLQPDFDIPGREGPVRSFCLALWGGVKDGSLKVDSANRPNGLVRVTAMNEKALSVALSILLKRYTVLNCRVEDRQGAPWLIPIGSEPPQIAMLDYRVGRNAADRDRAEQGIGELVWRPFEVAAGPLYRAYAVCFGQHEAYIGLVAHHLIADAVAISILLGELRHIYETIIRGAPLRLQPPGLSYQSYLQAMNDWIERGAGGASLVQVVNELKVFPEFDLATSIDPTGADEEEIVIEAPVALKVRSAARGLGVSPFTILLATQTVWLSRYCKGTVVPMKVITAGREFSKLANVVGNMADRMFVLTDLADCSSFADVVRQLQKRLSWCRRHAFIRYEFIHAAPGAAGISMAAPVFNFRTVRRGSRMGAGPEADASIRPLRIPPAQVAKTRPRDAYYLVVIDDGEEMWGSIRYGQGHITGFSEQFGRLLSKLCDNPDLPLGHC